MPANPPAADRTVEAAADTPQREQLTLNLLDESGMPKPEWSFDGPLVEPDPPRATESRFSACIDRALDQLLQPVTGSAAASTRPRFGPLTIQEAEQAERASAVPDFALINPTLWQEIVSHHRSADVSEQELARYVQDFLQHTDAGFNAL